MDIAAKLDDIGRPAWIALLVLGFIAFWPLGLAVLAYLVWSGRMGRMGCWNQGRGKWWQGAQRSSGNSAFDEYRADALRRLEEEQKEFMEFLERLRQAKDKAEFDQFMAERRRSEGPAPEAGAS